MKSSPFLKSLAALFLFLGMSAGLMAQRGMMPTPKEREAQLEKVIEKLELGESKANAFRELDKSFSEEVRALWENSADRSEMRDEMIVMRQEHSQKVLELLGEEKFTELRKIQQETREGRRPSRRGERSRDRGRNRG